MTRLSDVRIDGADGVAPVTAPAPAYVGPGAPGLSGAAAVVDALGTAVALVVEPGSTSRIRTQWARCLTDVDAVRTLDLRGQLDPDTADYVAASQVTLLGLVGQLGCGGTPDVRRVSLHAAGLADRSGSVIALVGASGSGKTTAAAVLGRDLGYVTDECVCIEPGTLDVLAYPKPLSVVVDPADPHHKTQRGPDELGLRRPPAGLRLRRVVLLHRSREPVAPTLTPVGMAEALMVLLPQVSGAARMARPLQSVADLILGTGGAVRLDYHEIGEAADLLTGLFVARGRARGVAEPPAHPPAHPPALPTAAPSRPAEPTGTAGARHDRRVLRRAPWVDVVDSVDHLVVFDGQRPHLLGGLGRLVWLLLEEPSTISAVHRRLTGLLGRHPDSLRLVRDAVDLLGSAGLVEAAAGDGSE